MSLMDILTILVNVPILARYTFILITDQLSHLETHVVDEVEVFLVQASKHLFVMWHTFHLSQLASKCAQLVTRRTRGDCVDGLSP